MHFCPICGGLLHAEQHQQMQLSCAACPYAYRLSAGLSSVQTRQVKKTERIFGGDDELKYGNKCTVQCRKCLNDEAYFMELQTRSADEPMTIFYQCTRCQANWKE